MDNLSQFGIGLFWVTLDNKMETKGKPQQTYVKQGSCETVVAPHLLHVTLATITTIIIVTGIYHLRLDESGEQQ